MRSIITRRRGAATVVAAVAAGALASAPAGARPAAQATAESNIVETAVAAGKFTTLVSLVKQAGLAETLCGKGPYTVFAPTDAAFKKVPKKTLNGARQGQGEAQVGAPLPRRRGPAGRQARHQALVDQDAQRPARPVRVRGGNVFVNKSKVVTADVRASNGIIHAVNRVLIP